MVANHVFGVHFSVCKKKNGGFFWEEGIVFAHPRPCESSVERVPKTINLSKFVKRNKF